MGKVDKEAKELFENKRIVFNPSTTSSYFFEVKQYSIRYDKRKKLWSCTCLWGSNWAQKGECKHVKACKLFSKKLNLKVE